MILRPPQFSLRTAIQGVIGNSSLAFGVYPQTIHLREVRDIDKYPEIPHLSMRGPTRDYSHRSKVKGYDGPIWASEIDIFSNETAEEAIEQLLDTLGNPSHTRSYIYEGRVLETSLRYDFPISKQPKQKDPAPHLIHFKFDRTGQQKESVERRGKLEFGEIGSLADRILYTQGKYLHWIDNPSIVEAARMKLAV
ncbi:hypothetical protein HYT57_02065 [Candidatus Woesearchaeota archaeon]|nr:hypothetical protein [Candidatus Woesearchaeota archaeon]